MQMPVKTYFLHKYCGLGKMHHLQKVEKEEYVSNSVM